MITLGYITNDVRRFRVFVANRCQKIRSYSQKRQWNHIESTVNPVDHASRGITFEEKEKVKKWFEGPAFLLKPHQDWKGSSNEYKADSDGTEVKCFAVRAQTNNETSVLSRSFPPGEELSVC